MVLVPITMRRPGERCDVGQSRNLNLLAPHPPHAGTEDGGDDGVVDVAAVCVGCSVGGLGVEATWDNMQKSTRHWGRSIGVLGSCCIG